MKKKNLLERKLVFFSPEQVGASLKEMDINYIDSEEDRVVSRWFHGTDDADIFIWTDQKKNIIKHQVAFCGQIVEWNILDGVRTGVVIEQEFKDQSLMASEMIRFDNTPQRTSVKLAVDVIHHVTALEDQVRSELSDQLLSARSLSNMKPEDVTRRYGQSRGSRMWNKFRMRMRKLFS